MWMWGGGGGEVPHMERVTTVQMWVGGSEVPHMERVLLCGCGAGGGEVGRDCLFLTAKTSVDGNTLCNELKPIKMYLQADYHGCHPRQTDRQDKF